MLLQEPLGLLRAPVLHLRISNSAAASQNEAHHVDFGIVLCHTDRYYLWFAVSEPKDRGFCHSNACLPLT